MSKVPVAQGEVASGPQQDTHSLEHLKNRLGSWKKGHESCNWLVSLGCHRVTCGYLCHSLHHRQQKAQLNVAGWLGAGTEHREGDNHRITDSTRLENTFEISDSNL